eukprot:CAMPEP_0194046770 /NCGR_PEP_ID=MMETSP0009_2-20130614/22294_1 /TAXON_ID=210454 /ORGANISM="Grammatophora oceanica, Strain CCMP 410" /LENGTH=436 /DNA_ID=CAMNT_0038692185 /DNA_START=90 /DNA_END=1400 /DNA_ORIENTATION=-
MNGHNVDYTSSESREAGKELFRCIENGAWEDLQNIVKKCPEAICKCPPVFRDSECDDDDEEDYCALDAGRENQRPRGGVGTNEEEFTSVLHLLCDATFVCDVELIPMHVLEHIIQTESRMAKAEGRPHVACVQRPQERNGVHEEAVEDDEEEGEQGPEDTPLDILFRTADDNSKLVDILKVFTIMVPECLDPIDQYYNVLTSAVSEIEDTEILREVAEILVAVRPDLLNHSSTTDPTTAWTPLSEYVCKGTPDPEVLSVLVPADQWGGNLIHRLASYHFMEQEFDVLFRVICNLPNKCELFQQPDALGDTPLHRAAKNALWMWGWCKCTGAKLAARMANKEGKLPFEVLLERWNDPNKKIELKNDEWSFLLQAYPDALERMNLDDRLFPRVLHEMGNRADQEGVWVILQQRPSLLSYNVQSSRRMDVDGIAMEWEP